MTVISFLNQKGGCGKSTLSINLASAFALQGERVLLVDADPQHSALDWQVSKQTEPLFPTVGLPTKDLHRQVKQHLPGYPWIIVDGPPRIDELARAALIVSDLVLVPVQPSPYDIWAAHEIIKLITEARQYREELRAAFVVNRKIVGTAIGREVVAALADYPIPVLAAQISQRVAFAESAASGMSVLEIDPNSAASQEIKELAAEVRSL